MNVLPDLRRLSTDLILLALEDQHAHCSHATGFLRAASMYGRIGSSSVATELYVRVTSVTCAGLVSKKISVSEFFLGNFTSLTNASDDMVLHRIIAKLPV